MRSSSRDKARRTAGRSEEQMLEMSSLVEAGIRQSIGAVDQKDRGAAEEVFKNETRINSIELEVDGLVIELLALHQPMAIDLRFIIAVLRINTNLERMGDLAVNIAHGADRGHNRRAGGRHTPACWPRWVDGSEKHGCFCGMRR